MVERDPNDEKNVIVEIRAGHRRRRGGALRRRPLQDAHPLRRAARLLHRGALAVAPEAGGFKEVTFEVRGDGAYSVHKFEGGTHRVQRVPETESQGRIHTSTATVVVLPEAEEVDVAIDPNDLADRRLPLLGPGGQSVNTTDSAVRITHKPTGIVVSMQDEQSQLQNRDKAMRVLRARLLRAELAEQQEQIASERRRRSAPASGRRSPHLQLSPGPGHRPPDQATSHNLDGVMDGELEEFTERALRRGEAAAAGGRSAA